ncbi:type I restriction-modification system endonuclease [Psychrobacter arenosus]|uniref:type I restriction-modification system endonuclease n=1 Tax=Psychrobacter arenosus TaxID=256326 RepID=UPI00191A1A72|nr:type I restriction-modification system endonuclease [Psychrobacter arenosus]
MSESKFTSNFDFMAEHDPIFLELATNAERVFKSDPNTSLIKMRQLGEALAQDLATRNNIAFDRNIKQVDLINRLNYELRLDKNLITEFHSLREEGNKAVHSFKTNHSEAAIALKMGRSLCIWYHKTYGKKGGVFKPAKFEELPDPSQQLQKLTLQVQQLSAQLKNTTSQSDDVEKITKLKEQEAALIEQEKREYQQLAEMMDEEARSLAEQNKQQEAELARIRKEFVEQTEQLQAELAKNIAQGVKLPTRVRLADFIPSEDDARLLIDEQLRQSGWLVDSEIITQANGEIPEVGKNKAIAEWTMQNGRADYVLFVGLSPVATIEAKSQNTNVSNKIQQAERYAKGMKFTEAMKPAWELTDSALNWRSSSSPDNSDYDIPFVFSCNGRPFIKQLPELSGIWFRDARKTNNAAKPLESFYSPEGLLDLLKRDVLLAEDKLKQEPFAYLGLRGYQVDAIKAVEENLEAGADRCLLAMATGTGKTRTIIGLIYRFLKAERFKRILFLVDRTALGEQAFDSMQEMTLEQNQTLSKIYNVAELGDMAVEAETRVQVATVQAMVKRIFSGDNPPTIDQYDCIIVDEAHRGYTLDQEMTEGELAVRDNTQYLSTYRRALDYFDAVKIGLTATPAKHTSEIFGKPVFNFSYREAVAADWLIDYEPPIRYETLLTKNGIHIDKGEQVSRIDTMTGVVDTAELEDELNFEVTNFNRTVITESFNRVICEQLAQEIDPTGDEKTLIFCATDLHADMVKRLLDEAFLAVHGDSYNEDAVKKITGASDKVGQLIRRYKNEKFPSVAITVDLLTTGIDVPSICHLVFLRRVKSRILFEQMIGRATRRCDDIGKTVFKVYDPVDIFASLQDVNTMKPLVKKPNITIDQLIAELIDNTPANSAEPLLAEVSESSVSYQIDSPSSDHDENGTEADTAEINQDSEENTVSTSHEDKFIVSAQEIEQHHQQVLAELSQKIMRVLRKADKKAERKPELKAKLDELKELWGVGPEKLHQELHEGGVVKAKEFLIKHSNLLGQLTEVKYLTGSAQMPVIYEGEDELLSREQGFGEHQRPDDYLESFDAYIRNNLNNSVALTVIATNPKTLTREALKEVKIMLDSAGYSEAKLRSAWREKTNQDIAASVIGHIRRAALGESLIPFEQRVNQAMQAIYASHSWTPLQRKWLDRLAKQLQYETLVDKRFVNESFASQGGVKQFDKVLQNKLDDVLEQVNEALWQA